MDKTCCFTGHRPAKLPWGSDESDERCQALKLELSGWRGSFRPDTGILSAAWPRAATCILPRLCWN